MKIVILYLTVFMLLIYGCRFNSSKDKTFRQEALEAENVDEVASRSKQQRLTSEELYSAINDSLRILFEKAVKRINFKTGEIDITNDELSWSSNKYPDLFWYRSDFELSMKKNQIGNKTYYITSCLKEGSEINIFGYILLEYQSSNYILKDTCFNIISEDYYHDTWTFDYYLTYTQDSLPIAIFKVGQGEETVAYRETIALFDIIKRKLIGDNITTRDLYDGMEETDGYKWESETIFSNSSYVKGYPDFLIKTNGTHIANKKVVDYNDEIAYKFDTEIKKYRQKK